MTPVMLKLLLVKTNRDVYDKMTQDNLSSLFIFFFFSLLV
jgi:hypothetical protein